MESNEIYKRFLLKINRNDSNEGVNILKSHFVIQFNVEADKWLIEKLTQEGDNIKLDLLDSLLETDVELKKFKAFDDCVEFTLPDNFRRHASSFSIVNKGNCKGVKIYNFDKKPLGFTAVLADKFNRPSFDFEETPFIISKNKMRVYFEDFEITSCFSTYYKQPVKIDIAGYTKFDGTPSSDIPSDLTDYAIDQVLNRMAIDIKRQFHDTEGIGLDKDRVVSEP